MLAAVSGASGPLLFRKLTCGLALRDCTAISPRKIPLTLLVSASVSITPSIRRATTVATPAAILNNAKAVRWRLRLMLRSAYKIENLRRLNITYLVLWLSNQYDLRARKLYYRRSL